MRSAAFWCLWATVFAIPWENVVVLPGLGTLSRLLGIVAAATGGAAVVLARKARRPNPIFLILVVYTVWGCLTVFWTIDPELTRLRTLTSVQLLALVWLVFEFGSEPGRFRQLSQAFVLGAWVAASNSWANLLSGNATTYMRFGASGFDANDFALTVALAVPFAWHIGVNEHRRLIRWTFLGYVPAAAVTVLLSASRGAFVALALALSLIVWTYPRLRFWPRALVVGSGLATAIVIPLVVPPASFDRLLQGVDEVREGSLTGRVRIWEAGLDAYREHPFLGVGMGAFRTSVAPELGQPWAAHNTYLGILVELGLVGMAIFFAVLVAAARGIWALPPPARRLWVVLGVTWGVGVLTLSWEHRKPTWLLLGLLAAQLAASRSAREESYGGVTP
jgi:O-antigen ligase